MEYKIREKTNEELRQKFIDRYVPRIRTLGLTVPDPKLQYDPETKLWSYSEPDWEWFGNIVKNNAGPKSQERIQLRKQAHEGQRWVRDAMVRTREIM